MTPDRGFFAVGVERISKPMNLGAILRTAHAFGASFAFTVAAHQNVMERELADTSKSAGHMPLFHFDSASELRLPENCSLVGVELSDTAIELPCFRHPKNAAYLLGPEDGSLSKELQDTCQFIVRIPTQFCLNLALATALVMYDRTLSLGNFAPRPIMPGEQTRPTPKTWPRRIANSKPPKG